MNAPKLHHYVPQFYLRRFLDSQGRLWVWDKAADKVFATGAKSIAAEKHFYWLQELEDSGHDPLTMERQLAELEGEVSTITEQWLGWLRDANLGDKIPIPAENRQLIASFIAVQFLRTAETRAILARLSRSNLDDELPTSEEQRRLHTALMWDEPTFRSIGDRLRESTWIFACNKTANPFVTSDHPVTFKTGDNRVWLKMGLFSEGAYAALPWSPDIIMYCHPKEGRWAKLAPFDGSLSPVLIDEEMADHENGGQVFGAARFVMGSTDDFAFPQEFKRLMEAELLAKGEAHLGFSDVGDES